MRNIYVLGLGASCIRELTVYIHQWIDSILVQVIACSLLCAKPLPKPMLPCCQLEHKKQTALKLASKYNNFHWRKYSRFENVACKMTTIHYSFNITDKSHGLWLVQCQAITLTNEHLSMIEHQGTNTSKFRVNTQRFSFNKIHLN